MPGMNDIELKDCILVLVFIIILYLLYKTRNVENFANDEAVKQINDIYKVDLSGLRNAGSIANSLFKMTNNSILTSKEIADNVTTPSDGNTMTLPFNNININPMIPNKLNINSNVVFNGKVSFTGSSNMMDMMPKGMILAWASNILPKGWAKCDGQTYYLDESGDVILYDAEINKGVINNTTTPNLIGRFILGGGDVSSLINTDKTNPYENSIKKSFDLASYGGTHETKINLTNLPDHTHILPASTFKINTSGTPDTQFIDLNGVYSDINSLIANTGPINTLGTDISGKSYTNMPPYYVLIYIIKI